jgi:riboflavin kinase/FMN adenylyltransferase
MRILRHLDAVPEDCRGAVVTLGNFDGFHRGHQAVLIEAAKAADRLGSPLCVLTQEPHPRAFFRPDLPPFRLSSLRAKASYLEEFGVDILVVLHFDAKLASTLAQDFVLGTLVGKLGVRHVVVGYDYRFGKGRGGGTGVLQQMAEMEGFGVTVVEPSTADGTIHSSTGIREALKEGRPYDAAALLGHWWTIDGRIEEGDQRGRTIGFPTANLPIDNLLEPKLGVYAVRARIEDGSYKGRHDGVANIGIRPTVGAEHVLFEVHLLDFSGDLYGRHLHAEIVEFIRPERKFNGLEALKAQIAKDADEARRILADPKYGADAFTMITRAAAVSDAGSVLAKSKTGQLGRV